MFSANKGFTLLELMIVVILIGILAALALPQFSASKEDTLDKEAKANLKLIQAAEKIYKMEMTTYYPPGAGDVLTGSTPAAIDLINNELKLSLPSADSRNWNYILYGTGCSQAQRTGGGRNWYLQINGDEPDNTTLCP